MVWLSPVLFRPACSDETILPADETIFCFWRRIPETLLGYQGDNDNDNGEQRWRP